MEGVQINEVNGSENFAFRRYLKRHADPEKLDLQFLELHKELFASYDCSKCRNCCREFCACFREDELEQSAVALGMTADEFREKYLKYDKAEGKYCTNNVPCDFFDERECKLEGHKPEDCKKFPFTDQPDRIGSLLNIIDFSTICPVVYEMLERLKEKYKFFSHR